MVSRLHRDTGVVHRTTQRWEVSYEEIHEADIVTSKARPPRRDHCLAHAASARPGRGWHARWLGPQGLPAVHGAVITATAAIGARRPPPRLARRPRRSRRAGHAAAGSAR